MYAKPGYMSYVSICTKMKIRFLFKFIHLVRTALILTSFKSIHKNKNKNVLNFETKEPFKMFYVINFSQ